MSWRVQNALIPNPLLFYVDNVTVDDGVFYQNWDDLTYRQKLLANVGSDITTASVRNTLSDILECPIEDIGVETTDWKMVDVTIPWGSDTDLIGALIGDMLLPCVEVNLIEA